MIFPQAVMEQITSKYLLMKIRTSQMNISPAVNLIFDSNEKG